MEQDERQSHVNRIRIKWEKLERVLDERATRLWAAAEADDIGYGGQSIVAEATGISRCTIRAGQHEVCQSEEPTDIVNVRRRGSGRPRAEIAHPELREELLKLVAPSTRGDPMSAARWTTKSLRGLATELVERLDVWVSPQVVSRMLKENGYSLQTPSKTGEGKKHPDRNAQFEHIDSKVADCVKRGVPVISVDTKKKELVGDFKNCGRTFQPKGAPEITNIHDFPDQAVAKAVPYGVYDVAANSGFVNVGIDHDTGTFAVVSIEAWWKHIGSKRYPNAPELCIIADGGGSNGHRQRLWKYELQRFANILQIPIHVSHFSPGASKWNMIEHRLFSFISINWRGRPLRTLETVVNLIGSTRTNEGLVVEAVLDEGKYPKGTKITDQQMEAINIIRDEFHGDWNYTIGPNSTE